jgi:tetrahydromethanopterin:alpha-L-glutamate ligase
MPPSLERLGSDRPAQQPIVGLVADKFDWHARQLADAFVTRGISAVPIRLPLCSFCTRSGSGLHIDGFGEKLPDAVIVRTMSGGTFEAVTLRLGILHALRDLGVLVWNDARAIERCVDKSMTSFLLTRAGIPTPETWVTASFERARSIVQHEAGSTGLVLKPLFGSQGRGLTLIRKPDDLPRAENKTGVYYLQRFVGIERAGGYHDFRLLVVRGRVIAAMQRHSSHWITNIKRGGRSVAVAINDEMKTLAVRAAAAVAADFAGVDIVYTVRQHPTVLEVNSMPAWSGLQKVTSANIAGLFVDALKAALAAHASRGATA